MIERKQRHASYIVKREDGSDIQRYSAALGDKAALSYAVDCAKHSKAHIFYQQTDGNENQIFRFLNGELKKV